ncbi:HD domain-containing phosphohydrolase [Clostridium lundense]|uniref:HD domain-containing phosphohydrolase n=1 Tax=Clostridium lundense TaxID=319475 RepID=UPI000A02DB6E|nr:HD domain-containing phosphohydrolase [Clostridium lundense]
MSKRIYKAFIIVSTVILIFLLWNNYTRTIFMDSKGDVSYNKESSYNLVNNVMENSGKTIVIGADKNREPYSFMDESGSPTGFNVEVVNAIGKVMGFNVKVKLGDFNEIKDDLEKGKIDAIVGMAYCDDIEENYDFTTGYTVANTDVFTRNDTNIKDISNLKGATVVVKANDIAKEYLEKQNLNIKFIEVPTVEEALKLVATKQYNYAVALRIKGRYLIKKEKYSNLKDNGLVISPVKYCLVAKKGNHDLIVTLNAGLKILKYTGRFDQIHNKWLGDYEEKTFYKLLLEHIQIIAIFLLIIVLLILWSISLKMKVDTRTKELLQANEALSKSQRSIEKEKELLKITLLSVGDGVIVTDTDGNITMFNKAAEMITGWKEEEAKLLNFEDLFNIIDEDTKEKCDNPVKKALEGMVSLELVQYKILTTKKGKKKIISYNVSVIKDNEENIKGVVLVFRDVTTARKDRKEIEFLSYCDQLTGLHNRRFFEEELERLNTKENLPLTICMADVNGLKLINDSFGHAAGDELLKKVTNVMINVCGDNGTISRIGGDEFVILLPKINAVGANRILKRISTLVSKEQVVSLNLSISLGSATKYYEEEDVFEVLKKAEDFMYKNKLFESPSMRGKTINAIINTLHEKNKREERHSYRVSEYCDRIGKVMDLPDGEIQELKTAGLLHDIGKIAINENILNKPDRLTKEEKEEFKRHPEIGYRILSSVNDMAEMAEYVLAHHEKWDGTGYPKGLKGEEIPLKARIIAIADAYDAMTSDRTYRSALPKEIAIQELINNAGSQFDPEIVKIFVEKVIGN